MSISKDNTRMILTIPKELKAELERIAQEQNRSVNNLILTIIKNSINNTNGVNYIENYGPNNVSISLGNTSPGIGNLNTYSGTAGSLSSMAGYITPSNYIGSGSGIAGTSSQPASYIVSYYGGSTKVKAKDSINFKRGSDIVSESCRIYVYLETKGGINNFQVGDKGEFSIGAGNWSGKSALKLLRDIIRSNNASCTKILGDNLVNLIKTSNKFNNKTFDKSQICSSQPKVVV